MSAPRLAAAVLAAALSLAACGDGASNAATATKTATTKTATAPAATRDWLQTITATPEGGFRQGNPDAKVKLLEFGSLTCSHCAAFAREGVPTLRSKYVAAGKVSYEYRPFILNSVDFGPSLLVRCQPPATAVKLIDAFYDQQPAWTEPFTKPIPDDVQKRIAALPEDQQVTAFAANGGLDGFMRTRGMTRAKFDACTSDKAGIAKLTTIRDDANTHYGLTGTPMFAINGTTIKDVSNWNALKPVLDAALN